MTYDLEIEKLIKRINEIKKKEPVVLLQFPDGLKKKALEVVDEIEEKTNAQCLIWMESCYGGCDVPVLSKDVEKKIDLLVQFGHTTFEKKKEK